jgi:hypothetical protein
LGLLQRIQPQQLRTAYSEHPVKFRPPDLAQ